MTWKETSFVLASAQRKRIVIALAIPMTPSHLAKRTGISLSNIGAKLNDLEKQGIVVCHTPKTRKGKIYGLTNKGKAVAKAIGDMEGK